MFNLLLLFVLDVSAQGSEEAPVAEPSDPVASEVDASEHSRSPLRRRMDHRLRLWCPLPLSPL